MIIDLSKPREEYFNDLSVTEVLGQFISKEGPITINDVRRLNESGLVVTGTSEGSLDSLLEWEGHETDSLALVEQIDSLEPDQLLVLPPNYRIDAESSRQIQVYDFASLVKLDSAAVKRKLIGPDAPKGRLSAKRKMQENWNPEKVISAAFNHLHENRDRLSEKVLAGYSWFGKDNHRRIVSLYRAIQGAELRAFQDFTAFRLVVPVMRKELQCGKSARSSYKEDLTPEQVVRRREKIQFYDRYKDKIRREGKPAGNYIRQLDARFSDLIEPSVKKFAHGTGRHVRVPSRSRLDRTYSIKLTGIPLVEPGNPVASSYVWELSGNCICEDKTYRSDRRRVKAFQGQDEDYFCAHEIASLHTLRRIHEVYGDKEIPFLPFVLPTEGMMKYVDKLRQQTIMLEQNDPDTRRTSKRTLNHTEIENLLWKRVMAQGYEANFTTNIGVFRSMRYDPHNDLILFK